MSLETCSLVLVHAALVRSGVVCAQRLNRIRRGASAGVRTHLTASRGAVAAQRPHTSCACQVSSRSPLDARGASHSISRRRSRTLPAARLVRSSAYDGAWLRWLRHNRPLTVHGASRSFSLESLRLSVTEWNCGPNSKTACHGPPCARMHTRVTCERASVAGRTHEHAERALCQRTGINPLLAMRFSTPKQKPSRRSQRV